MKKIAGYLILKPIYTPASTSRGGDIMWEVSWAILRCGLVKDMEEAKSICGGHPILRAEEVVND